MASQDTKNELVALLKEARKIIRASTSRSLAKDWDSRTTALLAKVENVQQKQIQDHSSQKASA